MRRSLVLLPIAAAGLSLALAASADPPAKKPAAMAGQPAAQAKKKTHKGGKHRLGATDVLKPHPTLGFAASPARNWGDYDVVEGTLAQATPGAACPSEMANVDDRFCI